MAVIERPIEMVKVKLHSARCGHTFDSQGRQSGVFSQAPGDIVEMEPKEAQRHFDAGLASLYVETKKG